MGNVTHQTIEMIEVLCQQVSDPILVLDQEKRLILFNPAAETALAVPAAEILGKYLADQPATHLLLPVIEGTVSELALPNGLMYRAALITLPEVGQGVVLRPTMTAEDARNTAILMGEVVHALKAPISAARGFIDLTSQVESLSDRQKTFIQRAIASLDHMLGLVHKLLDMAWLESGGQLSLAPLDLNNLARHSLAQFEELARRQGVDLVFEELPGGCAVMGDMHRLEGALNNLINNAIKYSPQGGQVTLTVRSQDQMATMTIVDHGIGIDERHFPRLFERFYRVHTSETQRIEGNGLGLAIVKAIIEKHGGTVSVQSAPGEGSTFSFSLPCYPSA